VGSRPPGVTWRPVRRSPDFPLQCDCSDCLADSGFPGRGFYTNYLTIKLSNSHNDNLIVISGLTMPPDTDAYKVTWLIRRLFRAMAERADAYLRDAGLTAADRAVLEFLNPDTRLTVPAIARRYQVSRQHVQVTVNHLIEQGFVETYDNPRHKRSPLLALTSSGQRMFATIRRRESAVLDKLFADIEIADIATTRRTLTILLNKLDGKHLHD
jgi:DNA-binding MarR family transcriptional regulator